VAGIVIQDLTKVYDDSTTKRSTPSRAALEGLNLDVSAGELLVVVGPSGSGKTTLLRLVAGLERPTAGRIELAGRDLTGVPPQGRNVALVFQSLALYEHLTVEQNLAFPLNAQTRGGWWSSLVRRGAATNEVQARVVETARRLRIEHLLDRRPAELSGGEQQRVALGRAIVRQPQALLLDEPLSSLDLPTRRSLRRELKALSQSLGVPTIYVTHDQAEALAIGDRIAVLDAGRLAQVGVPSEIYERPRTRFVAEFFGPMGMNWIEGPSARERLVRLAPDGLESPPQIGIRPENIELTTTTGQSEEFQGRVAAIEDLGEAVYVRLELADDNSPLLVRLAKNTTPGPAIGQNMSIRIPHSRLHWFDQKTGLRIEP
jgi:ABC-type sugar transport system ATPase subunit